jgi:uncharacterized protein (DUF2164 family)
MNIDIEIGITDKIKEIEQKLSDIEDRIKRIEEHFKPNRIGDKK